jgi:hypothetical protein
VHRHQSLTQFPIPFPSIVVSNGSQFMLRCIVSINFKFDQHLNRAGKNLNRIEWKKFVVDMGSEQQHTKVPLSHFFPPVNAE